MAPVRRRQPAAGSARSRPAEAAAATTVPTDNSRPEPRQIWMAIAPYLIIIAVFSVAQLPFVKTWLGQVGSVTFAWPGLDITDSAGKPVAATKFKLDHLKATGTLLLFSGLLTMVLYKVTASQGLRIYRDTLVQLRWTIVTVTAVLGLSFVMNLSGQTTTLGFALASAGGFFAILSPLIGWIGVALTGSDTSSNSLFGQMQATAAEQTGLSPVPDGRRQLLRRRNGQDAVPAEPGRCRRRRRPGRRGGDAVPQAGRLEPGPAGAHHRADLPAVHARTGLDGPLMAPLDLAALRSAVHDPAQVKTRAIDLHANAHDASHFLLIPQAVVTAGNAAEVGGLLRASAAQGVPLTFRSGGTSLSGQAVTDGVLVDVRRNFRDIEVLDDGARVRVQPGVTVRALNARLARYGRKFGPDPASEAACTIGGVVANNSSGMNCGTVDNTYRTLESLTVVLPSGTVIDTGAADADQRLRALEPELYEGLARLAERVRNNAGLRATGSGSSFP